MAFNTCTHVIKEDGSLWGWGVNSSGQVGDGTMASSIFTRKQIGVATDWAAITSGSGFTIGLKKDGTLWGTGESSDYQLLIGNDQRSFIQLGAENDWKFVSAGHNHVMAIKEDGTLWGWGQASAGGIGNGQSTSGVRIVPEKIGTDTDWKMLSCGTNYTIALKEDGTLWGWGSNANGRAGVTAVVPTKASNDTDWAYLSAGSLHSLALKQDGSLWGTGSNSIGRLGLGDATTLATWTAIPSEQSWKAVSVGSAGSYGIKADGSLWACGSGTSLANGDPDGQHRLVFTKVGFETYWKNLKGGVSHCCMLREDGEIFGFGISTMYQLGNNTTANQALPVTANMQSAEYLYEAKRFRAYPILTPASVIVDCTAQVNLKRLIVAGIFPSKTHVRLLVSSDKVTWKSYDAGTSAWKEVAIGDSSTGGMTREVLESLREEELQLVEGVPFSIAITIWTEAINVSPTIRGLDAVVSVGAGTASVQSIGINYRMLEPEKPSYFVSRDNGVTWMPITPDTMASLDALPEGNELRVKAVLANGQEMHGLSYSWV